MPPSGSQGEVGGEAASLSFQPQPQRPPQSSPLGHVHLSFPLAERPSVTV